MSEKTKNTVKRVLQIISYLVTAILGALGGATL